MSALLIWPINAFEYDGLCSHPTLTEAVSGQFNVTAAQIEAQADALEEIRVSLQRITSHNWEQDLKEENIKACRARNRKKAAAERDKDKVKVNARYTKNADKVKASKKYYCAVCDWACAKKTELTKHNTSKTQLAKVAAIDILSMTAHIRPAAATSGTLWPNFHTFSSFPLSFILFLFYCILLTSL